MYYVKHKAQGAWCTAVFTMEYTAERFLMLCKHNGEACYMVDKLGPI